MMIILIRISIVASDFSDYYEILMLLNIVWHCLSNGTPIARNIKSNERNAGMSKKSVTRLTNPLLTVSNILRYGPIDRVRPTARKPFTSSVLS
jgi:hypothetical protein